MNMKLLATLAALATTGTVDAMRGGQAGQATTGQRGQAGQATTGQRGQAGQATIGQRGQAGQRGRGGCDLATETPAMQAVCCTAPEDLDSSGNPTCPNGMPTTCSVECAAAFQDFWDSCGQQISRALGGGQRGQTAGQRGQATTGQRGQAAGQAATGQQAAAGQRGRRQLMRGGQAGQATTGQAGQAAAGQRGQAGQAATGQRGGGGVAANAQDFADFNGLCATADSSAEASDCSLRGAGPIIMACANAATAANFCSTECYTRLAPYAQECSTMESAAIISILSPYISQMASCPPVPTGSIVTAPADIAARCRDLWAATQSEYSAVCCEEDACSTMPATCTHECAAIATDLVADCPVANFGLPRQQATVLTAVNSMCQATQAGTAGNPACWSGQYTFANCCTGTAGNPSCWSGNFNYDFCCPAPASGGGTH